LRGKVCWGGGGSAKEVKKTKHESEEVGRGEDISKLRGGKKGGGTPNSKIKERRSGQESQVQKNELVWFKNDAAFEVTKKSSP